MISFRHDPVHWMILDLVLDGMANPTSLSQWPIRRLFIEQNLIKEHSEKIPDWLGLTGLIQEGGKKIGGEKKPERRTKENNNHK